VNTESQILNVPIEDIIPNRFQPRLSFDESGLQDLADSIKEHGIIQPLVLRRAGDKYEIIAGERRYKASKMAGLASVPAIISLMDDKQSAEAAIVENVQRRDLSSIEEAKSYKALLDKGYLTQEELARKMGISQSAISNKLRLLSLDDSVQTALMEGRISERHARSLLKLESKEEQVKWLKRIIDERLTVQLLDRKLKEELQGETPKEEVHEEVVSPTPSNVVEDIKPVHQDVSNFNQTVNDINNNSNDGFDKPMPNKFFNFLEDESANMGMVEREDTVVIPPSDTLEETLETLDEPVSQNPPEEIEMLDFDVSASPTGEHILQIH
jgi:ParB family chromosome partitioning protein